MKNLLLVGLLVLLFSECSIKKIDKNEVPFNMEVKNSYIQREVAGVANVEDRLYIVLEITHSENCKIETIEIQGQNVVLKEIGTNLYQAFLNSKDFANHKYQDQQGILFFSVGEEDKEVNVYGIKQNEVVYLP